MGVCKSRSSPAEPRRTPPKVARSSGQYERPYTPSSRFHWHRFLREQGEQCSA